MKIPLEFIDGAIVLNGILRAARYRVPFKKIMFIVDTGSPKTFISEKDALISQIPFSALKFVEYMRIGGSKYKLLTGKKSDLYFKTDEKKSVKFDFNLSVTKTTKTTQEGKIEAQSCPSIMGTDFLIQNKLSLIFKPFKNIYYLKKEE